jgi:hypothetical protein
MTSQDETEGLLDQPPIRPGTKVLLTLFVLAIIAVGVVWLFVPRLYWAEAWIECISDQPRLPRTLVQTAPGSEEHLRFIWSQANLVETPEVLEYALRSPEVRSTEWFKHADKEHLVQKLQDALTSEPIGDSNFVRVAMGCREREDAATIVEQVALRCHGLIQGRAKDAYRDELAESKNEEQRLDRLIDEKLEQIRAFVSNLPPGALSDEGSIARQQILTLSGQVTALELQTHELEGLEKIYSDPAGPGVSAEYRELVEEDPFISRLKHEQIALEVEQASLPDTPESEETRGALARRLAALEQKLDELRTQKLVEVQDARREEIRVAYLNSQNQLFLAREALLEAEAAQADLDRKLAELELLNDELAALKQDQQDVRGFIADLEAVIESKQTVRVSIARHAEAPDEPDYSPHIWMTVIALGVPVVFGLGLVSLRALRRAPKPATHQASS